MKVLYIFTFDYSLETWYVTGTLEKELTIFQELVKKKNINFTFLTYGGIADIALKPESENLNVLPIFENMKKGKNKFIKVIKSLYFVLNNIDEIKKYDLIQHNQLNGSWLGVFIKLVTKKPYILRTGYDTYKFSIDENKSFLKKVFFLLLTNFNLLFADFYTVTSKADFNFSKNYRIQPKKIEIRPNWIVVNKENKFRARDSKKILAVGRLEKQKNFERLINDFKNSDYEIDIVGVGSKLNNLLNLSEVNKVNVNFLGQLNNIELNKKYSQYRYFISTSYFEGNPKTVLEAMSNGCVVLLSEIDNHKELVNDNTNGFLVKDNESFCEKVKNISQDIEVLTNISKAAVDFVFERNDINKLVQTIYEDYELLSLK